MHGLAAAMIGLFTAPGRGPADLFSGLFQDQARLDWPNGVQEPDAPHFAVEHAEALRPGADSRSRALDLASGVEPQPEGEIIELFNRRLPS